MHITRADCDQSVTVVAIANEYARFFSAPNIDGGCDPFEKVQCMRDDMWARFERAGTEMEALLRDKGDEGDRVNWGARVIECYDKFDTLDKNLAFKRERQWRWEEVGKALGFIYAAIQGAEATLLENGVC